MKNRVLTSVAVLALAACSAEKSHTIGGAEYRADQLGEIDEAKLPRNSALEMAGGDLAKYAADLCSRSHSERITRCELYIQQNTGLLQGYTALVTRPEGVSVETEFAKCFITGTPEVQNQETYDWHKLASSEGDFRASLEYTARERSPNDWVVSAVDRVSDAGEYTPGDGDTGQWSFEKVDNKLRIMGGRWSYCSDDQNVDEVFTHVLNLTKMGAN